MKVCLINHFYRPFIGSGAENVVENIVDGFLKNGDEILVITTKPRFCRQITPPSNQRIFYLGSSFHFFCKMPYFFRIFWHLFNIFDFLTARKVKKILRKEKPDLVITNNLAGMSYLIPPVIKELKIKHLHILHDIQLLHPSGLLIFGRESKMAGWPAKIYQFFVRIRFSKVDVVVSPSRWLLDAHLSRGFFIKAQKKILSNPVIAEGTQTLEKLDRDGDVFKILCVAQIEEHKGIFFLLKAWQQLLSSGFKGGVKLLFVGDGQKKDKLESLIKKDKDVEYLGRLDRPGVYSSMLQSDLLVVPSLCYENSPTVIFEAISKGLPVLAANIGGVGEIINKYGGFLFNPADINDLNAKIVWAIKNPREVEEVRRLYWHKSEELINSSQSYINSLKESIFN